MPKLHVIRHYLGFSVLMAWISLLYSSKVLLLLPGSLPPLANAHLFSTSAVLVTAGILAVLSTRLSPLQHRRELLYLVSIAGALGTAGIPFVSAGLIAGWWSFVCVGVAGVCSTVISVAWMERFAVQQPRPAFICFVAANLIGSGLHLVLTLLPQTVSIVCVVLLPVVSAFSLWPAPLAQLLHYDQASSRLCDQPNDRASNQSSDLPSYNGCGRPSPNGCHNGCERPSLRQLAAATPMRFIIAFGIISFAGGALQTLQLPNAPVLAPLNSWLFSLAASVAAMGIGCVFALLSYRVNYAIAFYIAIPAITCAALLLALLPELPSAIAHSISGLGLNLVNLLVWLLLVHTVHERRIPAVWCFAIFNLVQFAGTLLGQLTTILAGSNLMVIALALLVSLIFAALVAMGAHRQMRESSPGATTKPTTDYAEQNNVGLDVLTRALAAEYGLTPREQEVLLIWVKGHNSSHIEKTLFISKNTVKTHLSHIYHKIGTDNRQELLTLLEQRGKAARMADQE